jgi:hypothetical protein
MSNIHHDPLNHRRNFIMRLIFPSLRVRFTIALLMTFFPNGFFFWLDYPGGELITLCAWLWVFPSFVGLVALCLAPLIPTNAYGYYAFNLFCFLVDISVVYAAWKCKEFTPELWAYMHKLAKKCMIATLVLAGAQAMTNPDAWMAVLPRLHIEEGRGAGLRIEPSEVSSLLALYLVLLVGRMWTVARAGDYRKHHNKLVGEAVLTIILSVVFTRSLTVLLVASCFIPVLFLIRRKQIVFTAAILVITAGALSVTLFGDRIHDATATSSGSLVEFLTTSLGSWRNTPDVLILSSPADFLLPGPPSEVRLKIHDHAVMLSPLLGWIQNTFSTFSAASISVGLVATLLTMLSLLMVGLKRLHGSHRAKMSWVLVFILAWIFLAKWDLSGWIVLGLLPLAHISAQRTEILPAAA